MDVGLQNLKWNVTFLVGIDIVDTQHQDLFRFIDEYIQACLRLAGHHEIEQAFTRMIHYAHTHFRDEEAWMLAHEYPDRERHIGLHQAFFREVENLYQEFRSNQNQASMKLAKFAVNWITHHVKTEDMRIKAFLVERDGAHEVLQDG